MNEAAYKATIISTLVDIVNTMPCGGAYKATIISTLVDHALLYETYESL